MALQLGVAVSFREIEGAIAEGEKVAPAVIGWVVMAWMKIAAQGASNFGGDEEIGAVRQAGCRELERQTEVSEGDGEQSRIDAAGKVEAHFLGASRGGEMLKEGFESGVDRLRDIGQRLRQELDAAVRGGDGDGLRAKHRDSMEKRAIRIDAAEMEKLDERLGAEVGRMKIFKRGELKERSADESLGMEGLKQAAVIHE